jgi:hypothetical protein
MKPLATAERGVAYTPAAPVTGAPVLVPEYADVPGVYALFGLKRSLLYALMAEGRIKSISLKEPGERSGKRLINVASVREYLASKAKAGR